MIRKKTASTIWGIDKAKSLDLESAGYTVLRIAEKQFRDNPASTIQQCKRFLGEN